MLFSLVSNGTPSAGEQPDAIVPWWSFTKTVLAAAALALVRDGLVDLDEVLPEGPFTLRQLLRHEAGLADYGELADYHAAVARNDPPWSADEMLQRLDAGRLRYAPGTGWGYSNVGYWYVSRLITRLCDVSLEQALIQRVFAPLGLSNVSLATTPEALKDVRMGSAAAYHPGWVYHGLLVGSLKDAAVCLERLMTSELLGPSLRNQMQTAYPLGGPIAGRPWIAPGYGLGLMHGPVRGGRVLSGHTGSGPGSVVAVHHCAEHENTATCAVFLEDADQGSVEAQVVHHLFAALDSAAGR